MTKKSNEIFTLWRRHSTSPHHFPMSEEIWSESIYTDIDSDGRKLFAALETKTAGSGLIQYGHTAFGFDDSGEISEDIHYPVIRCLCFEDPEVGQTLLDAALRDLSGEERIYAFFHYFGMSACGRHGKLHEKDTHVEALLLENGFVVEHENVYYARTLTGLDVSNSNVNLRWNALSPGGCREFAAVNNGQEIGWGQVHFLPQGDIAYLRWIYIDERRQHQGLGTATMQALFADLYQMGIRQFDTDTALNNVIAQRYYEKTGFSNEGITRSYYTK